MDEIVQLISNVGFPIGACVVLFMQQKEMTKSIIKLNETLIGIDKRIDNLERRAYEQNK